MSALFVKNYSSWSRSNGGFSRVGCRIDEVRLMGRDPVVTILDNVDDERLRYHKVHDTRQWPVQETYVTVEIRDESILPVEIQGIKFGDEYDIPDRHAGNVQAYFIDRIERGDTGEIVCTRKRW